MTALPVHDDPLWPRAAEWIASAGKTSTVSDLAIIGVPAHRTSITPTGANETPEAVRRALERYSPFAASRGVDLKSVSAVDLGDVVDPDGAEGEIRVRQALRTALGDHELLVALGGDNSITFSVMTGLFGDGLGGVGLVTVDAHHDVRDGETNGSPVRRLVEAGLPGQNVVQIGIADFANSSAYSARARDLGITVIPRDELRRRPLGQLVAYAFERAGAGGRPVFVDLDVDVCDRAAAPGCPSAVPGGISADELRQIAFHAGRDPRVRGLDVVEIDATQDASDGRTVRLAALLVLEAAAGLAARLESRRR